MMANRTMILEDETEHACHSCGDLFPACEMHEALGAWMCLEDECLCAYIEHLERKIQLMKKRGQDNG